MLKNHPEMPSLIQTEFSNSVSAVSDDFYMATVGGGKVQKVINMRGGPLRVRRVLEFNTRTELEKEQALFLKRKQLGYEPGNKVGFDKREKTLADFVQELKRRKSGEALATVQWNPPPVEEVNLVEIISPTRKKKRRRNTSELLAYTGPLDSPCEHVIPQREDETLSGYLKKSVGSTGRASSDNTCIKVFQRRKVKFKAVRARALEAKTESANAGSKSRDRHSSTTNLMCENLCECEECQPSSDHAAKLASPLPTGKSSMSSSTLSMVVSTTSICEDQAQRFPEIETAQSTNTVPDLQPVNGGFSELNDLTLERLSTEGVEKLSHPDTNMSELLAPKLADDSSLLSLLEDPSTQEPAIHDTNDIEEITMEQFRGEVAQQVPSDVTALGSRFSCVTSPLLLYPGISVVERHQRPFDASNVGPEMRESDVQMLSAEVRPHSTSETFGIGNLRSFSVGTEFSTTMPLHLEPTYDNSQSAAANSASVVTPLELEIAEERIGALLNTLVTPDDLLPVHLSASRNEVPKSSKKKKRSFRETATLNMSTVKRGSCLGTLPVTNLGDDMTAPFSVDSMQFVTENVPSSRLDIMEEVSLSDPVENTDMSGILISNETQLVSEEHGIVRALSSSSEDTPTVCPTTVTGVLANVQESTVLSAEEHCANESDNLKAIEVIETPWCNEELEICQTSYAVSDGEERDSEDACVGDISTLKVDLFSDLKSDGLSKRNRKSFSPNSRLALINAARSESEWIPTFRIKLSKSNLSDQCPSKLTFQKTVVREICPHPDETPTAYESSAPNVSQDMLHCNMEQTQLVALAESDPLPLPPQTTEDDSSSMDIPSGPPSDFNTHTALGSPEHTKEPSVPRQSGEQRGDMRAVNVDTTLTHTEGSSPINVECHSPSPTGPSTPNEKLKPSEQPKSILKTGEVTCQGICKCPKCISTSDLSKVARKFITSQMIIAEDITSKLLDEMRNMRTLLEADKKPHEEASTSCDFPSEKAKEALKSASKTEDWAIKEILKLSRDSKRVCRLIETGPRRTIFADDAGRQLEHVRLLPAKKILKRVGSA